MKGNIHLFIHFPRRDIKKGNRKVPVPLGNAHFLLLEVTLQQTLQGDAVASLVTSHLVDGVVDSIQAVLLGADSQIELALSCAELAVRKSVRSGHFLRQFLLCAFG